MKMPVIDFSITPLLCPLGRSDCSPCIHASNMKVFNPSSSGVKEAVFGSVECSFLEKFQRDYSEKEKKYNTTCI